MENIIFLLNHIIVRLTKIMNILIFKVLFQCIKLIESFQKILWYLHPIFSHLIRWPTYMNELFWKLWIPKYFVSNICPIFVGSVHRFGSKWDKNKDAFLISGQNCTFVSMASLKFKSLTDSNVSPFPLGKCHSSYLVRER